jgi:hypothetical protein
MIPDTEVHLYRRNGRVTRCEIRDGDASIDLPITHFRLNEDAAQGSLGTAEIGVLAMRVYFHEGLR